MKVCNVNQCPNLFNGPGGKCPTHRRQADQARGTASQRGYSSKGHQRFREAVLAASPVCQLCHLAIATVADHYPNSRREQILLGRDPDDPTNGRALCKACHDRETARNQPGGWNHHD